MKIFKRVFTTICTLGILCSSHVIAQEHILPTSTVLLNVSENSAVSPRADVMEWKTKTVNGVRYRRLWNRTKQVWVGDWEKC